MTDIQDEGEPREDVEVAADGKQTRRQFTDSFKADVVELCRSSDKSVGRVAGDMDLTETVVQRWVAQAELGPPTITGSCASPVTK